MNVNNPLLPYVGNFQTSGNLERDIKTFFLQHECEHIFHHVKNVASKAEELAERFGADMQKCVQAAWLHDISGVVPNAKRVSLANALGLEVLPEEEAFPMIIHQKLSVSFANELFGIIDEKTLSAIGCHTTLKAGASLCDHVVFVADKIAWDQSGTPPYLPSLLEALNDSVEASSLVYINYLWEMRNQLRVIHPWLVDAREELMAGEK